MTVASRLAQGHPIRGVFLGGVLMRQSFQPKHLSIYLHETNP